MSLNLHPDAKTAMVAALKEGLPVVEVKNGSFLDSATAFIAAWKANEALPVTGKLRERLVDYTDDLPFIEFCVETLRHELQDSYDYVTKDKAGKLSDLVEYKDLDNVAKRLVSLFNSLPWQYSIAAALPERIMPNEVFDGQALPLGHDTVLTKQDMIFSQQFPLSHPNPRIQSRARKGGLLAALAVGEPKWEENGIYFVQSERGFVGIYGGGNLFDRTERKLESFLGLGLASKLFSYNFKFDNPKLDIDWYVHKRRESSYEFFTRVDMSEDIAGVVQHITSFRFADSYPVEHRVPWLQSVLSRANKIFASDRSKTLLLSAKWFFDSFKGTDETLKYIRLMTTLEILLGEHADTSRISLGETLGNRLAYLIGKNHQDRADILSEFKKVYGVRSSILHHGKHRLRGDERSYITRLRSYCERAIEEEARLILA